MQSAFARYVLNRQLSALALYNPEEAHHECDMVFNDGRGVFSLGTRLLIPRNSMGEQW